MELQPAWQEAKISAQVREPDLRASISASKAHAFQSRMKAVMKWREEGRPVVGPTCSFVPAGIFYAAGVLPVRLRGLAARRSAIGDSYFGPFICSFPKCLLELAGSGAFRFLDGAVITPGCDAMRRLHECWRKAGEDIPGKGEKSAAAGKGCR